MKRQSFIYADVTNVGTILENINKEPSLKRAGLLG
jgi:hypothetical protein